MTVPGLHIDSTAATPVYRQIADGIRAALEAGRIHPGTQLPPTRDLAKQLRVNRNTVIAAYDLLSASPVDAVAAVAARAPAGASGRPVRKMISNMPTAKAAISTTLSG